MKIKDWIKEASNKLASTPTPRLDSLILLEDVLDKDRSWLLANPDTEIPDNYLVILKEQLARRANHEPLAYIRGKSEFYGREFIVTPATLQPRPETETMIETLADLELPKNTMVADIGTGSGCIAITTKLEKPNFIVHATEINKNALNVAQKNASKLNADIEYHQGDLLEPLAKFKLDIILANLPYVPDEHTINHAAMHEPGIAIFGGKDGLDLYRKMFSQIRELGHKPKYVLTESLPYQHEALNQIAKEAGYELQQTNDFIQVFIA